MLMLQCKDLSSCFCSKVKVLYKVSQSGYLDTPQKNDHLSRLLNDILLVNSDELSLLQYWRSALPKELKEHLKKSNTD